jgi:predicted nucleic acid-binding protein
LGLILIDSSVWIDHLRQALPTLGLTLAEGRILQHPMVTAEIALGSIQRREQVIAQLQRLEQAAPVDEAIFLQRVDEWNLAATGVGFVDAHLLCSAAESGAPIWTSDRRLAVQAERLGLRFTV